MGEEIKITLADIPVHILEVREGDMIVLRTPNDWTDEINCMTARNVQEAVYAASGQKMQVLCVSKEIDLALVRQNG